MELQNALVKVGKMEFALVSSSSYSVPLLVTWSPCYKSVDNLIILVLFSIIPKLIIPSRLVSAIKIPKIIST